MGAFTVAVIVSVCLLAAPTFTVPTVQTPVPALYEPWLGVALTYVSSALTGKVSVNFTLWAVLGPLFVTVTVNVIVSPTFGVALLTVFTTARSAELGVIAVSPEAW